MIGIGFAPIAPPTARPAVGLPVPRLAVGRDLAPSEGGELVPDRVLERGAAGGERKGEFPALPGEVFLELARRLLQNTVRVLAECLERESAEALDREVRDGLPVAAEF